jgi:signal transduction histidine kinase
MRRLLGYFWRRRIGVQIAVMVVVPPVVIHLLLTMVFLLHLGNPPALDHSNRDLDAIVRIMVATPAPARPALLDTLRRAYPQLALAALGADAIAQPTAAATDAMDSPPPFGHLGPQYQVFNLPGDPGRIGIQLPDGTAIAATAGGNHPGIRARIFLGGPWSTAFLSIVISISLLSWWAAHTLTAPLSAFAKAAESFSLDGAAAPLPEAGPDEVRRVARAFNRMRERITALLRDRVHMLAAISHDLRTPITRLRLRSEFIEDEGQRHQMLRDLDQMRAMLDSVLSLLRNDHARDRKTPVDVPAILQQIRDQFADLGHDVTLTGATQATVLARPDDLNRAITNLVENAVRYGAHVEIRLLVSADAVMIDVDDNGPGMDDASKAEMLQPFVRGDAARNLDEASGFGLGLSITSSIIAAHGGTLTLLDREPSGLTARITLPVVGKASAA